MIDLNKESWFNSSFIYPDFPVEGVNFLDIFALLREPNAIRAVMSRINPHGYDAVLIPESRGFLFASALDLQKVIPLRKKGKLPGELMKISYHKEYGDDELYLPCSALSSILELKKARFYPDLPASLRVMFFDDVLATGGTAKSIIDMINRIYFKGVQLQITKCLFIVELKDLKGRELIEDSGVVVESVYSL